MYGYYKITTVILILGLSPFTNALFFGLFSSKPTPKPDVIVSESTESETDKLAYENYLRSLASTYPSYRSVQYIPIYAIQPQYREYVQPQRSYIYPATTLQSIQSKPSPVQIEYIQQPYTTSAQFQKPIAVLPSVSYQQPSPNIPEVARNLNKLIEAPATGIVISKTKTIEYEMPEPQMPATLYDLPVPGISQDFRTGGYVTKGMVVSHPSNSSNRSSRKFSHAYNNGDGTKVSEEGHLVQYENGQETVVKRGQYEYLDATGKPVLVKWIADDDGYRLVN